MTEERGGGKERAAPARRLRRLAGVGVVALLALCAGVDGGAAQELADYDYENLGFRGVGVEGGYIVPNTVKDAYTVGARIDLGYLGPGFRVVPSLTYWSSELKDEEVGELEERLADLVVRESEPGTPRPDVDLGEIAWTDVILGVDGHFVWRIPLGLLGYAGAGASAHLLDGQGEAIADTFIEDLLDSVRAGFNLHAGLEIPVHDRFRLYSTGRYEMLGDLRYFETRVGAQLMFGPPAPGEEASR